MLLSRVDVVDKLTTEYFNTRPNLSHEANPVCVFFFAVAGAGKSTLRRALVERLKFTYVCNNEMTELLDNHPEAAELGIGVKEVVEATRDKIWSESPNQAIIFDNSIVRYYMHPDSYLNVAIGRGIPVFVIDIHVPEEQLVVRIKDRGVNVAFTLDELPSQITAYEKAVSDMKVDFVYKSGIAGHDLEDLVDQLKHYS